MSTNHSIDLTYFSYGNRNFDCLRQYKNVEQPSSAVKAETCNRLERNYLCFPSSYSINNKPITSNRITDESKNKNDKIHIVKDYHPEYKEIKTVHDQQTTINDYINPIKQYVYHDNPMVKSAEQIFSFQKEKKYVEMGRDVKLLKLDKELKNNKEITSEEGQGGNKRITLKNPLKQGYLYPNNFILELGSKGPRRKYAPSINANMEDLRKNSFLESKFSPEYLRNYDNECLKNIDEHYIKNKKNLHVLSRFGNWITVDPETKDRRHPLENIKYGTYETAIVAPEWMDIRARNNGYKNLPENEFRPIEWTKDRTNKTKINMLVDRDQKNARPVYLRDSYEKNAILLGLKKEKE